MDTNELENKAQADEQNEDQPAKQGGALSATESQSHLSDLEPREQHLELTGMTGERLRGQPTLRGVPSHSRLISFHHRPDTCFPGFHPKSTANKF